MSSRADLAAGPGTTTPPRGVRVATAIAAAAVLAYGVLVLDWPVLTVMLLFWLENVLIGGFNVIKMLRTGRRGGPKQFAAAVGDSVLFTLHYGLFTLLHGIFVITLFSSLRDGGSFEEMGAVLHNAVFGEGFFVALGMLFVMQLLEFLRWRRQPMEQSPSDLMRAPYGRILILHLTLVAGGMLILALGAPVVGVLMLVALKLVVDLREAVGGSPLFIRRRVG
jgi:hypothetical protein